jgi:hypothetical protein
MLVSIVIIRPVSFKSSIVKGKVRQIDPIAMGIGAGLCRTAPLQNRNDKQLKPPSSFWNSETSSGITR